MPEEFPLEALDNLFEGSDYVANESTAAPEEFVKELNSTMQNLKNKFTFSNSDTNKLQLKFGDNNLLDLDEVKANFKGDPVNGREPNIRKAISDLNGGKLPEDINEETLNKIQRQNQNAYANNPVTKAFEKLRAGEEFVNNQPGTSTDPKNASEANSALEKAGQKSNWEAFKENGKSFAGWLWENKKAFAIIAAVATAYEAVNIHRANINGCWMIQGSADKDKDAVFTDGYDVEKCKVRGLTCSNRSAKLDTSDDDYPVCETPQNLYDRKINPDPNANCNPEKGDICNYFNPIYRQKGNERKPSYDESTYNLDVTNYYKAHQNWPNASNVDDRGGACTLGGGTICVGDAANASLCTLSDEDYVSRDCETENFYMYSGGKDGAYTLKKMNKSWFGALFDMMGDLLGTKPGLNAGNLLKLGLKIFFIIIGIVVGIMVLKMFVERVDKEGTDSSTPQTTYVQQQPRKPRANSSRANSKAQTF